MTSAVNDIVKQANQGSVAAIIQVLNEELADSGVRTRAIFADGVLQLLCEAATADQLEPAVLIGQIRQTLEAIAPRHIRRVNINSRIVREQQLLWLEEISRDPENQLLWSQEITLKKPNVLQQWLHEWKHHQAEPTSHKANLPQRSPRQQREQRQFWRGLMGGAGVSVFVLLGAWALYNWLGAAKLSPTQSLAPTTGSSVAPPVDNPTAAPTAAKSDSFTAAVRLAEQASQAGTTAKSQAQWLELAAHWQQASDLMASVPSSDSRYKTAQDRVAAYRKNSESALAQAKREDVPATSAATSSVPEPNPNQ